MRIACTRAYDTRMRILYLRGGVSARIFFVRTNFRPSESFFIFIFYFWYTVLICVVANGGGGLQKKKTESY